MNYIHYCCLFYYAGKAKMFSVETLKAYVAVEFIDSKTNDIVFEEWLQTLTECHWPSQANGEEIQRLLRGMVASEPTWDVYRPV